MATQPLPSAPFYESVQYYPSITLEQKYFLESVIEDSIKTNLIPPPPGWKASKKNCCRVDDAAVIAATSVFFVFSFFVGAYYAAHSAKNAVEANGDLKIAREVAEKPPAVSPQFGKDITKDLYEKAVQILEIKRGERIVAMCAQIIMTAGLGLLTVAFFITLIVEPQILTMTTGLSGTGLFILGIMVYFGKIGCFNHKKARYAANSIVDTLKKASSSPTNSAPF